MLVDPTVVAVAVVAVELGGGDSLDGMVALGDGTVAVAAAADAGAAPRRHYHSGSNPPTTEDGGA